MSGLLSNYLEDRLEVLAEWDVDALSEALSITTEELLQVPAFRNRAEQWIQANCSDDNEEEGEY